MEEIFARRADAVDTVTYAVYGDFANQQVAEDFAAQAMSHISDWTADYIWHKDPFNLSVKHGEGSVPLHVGGVSRFGDCLDDEWFIVSLLLEISKKFSHAAVSVHDNDGEFLLIEAADFLPSWLDPSTSMNRVFLHRGLLHMIPMPRTPAEIPLFPTGKLTLTKALELVRGLNNTTAPAEVQAVITDRLGGLPATAGDLMHQTRCYLPHKIAHILHMDPALVAPAVEAFYTRDPIAMKACYKMDNFPPNTNVLTTVRMNRPQYAQLVSQKFHPPKPFRLPPSTAKNFKQHDLGMKLACGFEMLLADQHLQNVSKQNEGNTLEFYNFDVDPEWLAFLSRLGKLNYFRDELPGSKLYKKLLKVAQAQYLDTKTSSSELDNPLNKIYAILKTPLVSEESLSQLPDKSDSWMEVDPLKLDDLLNKQKLDVADDDWTKVNPDEEEMSEMDEEDRRDMEELAKMMGGFSSFVEKKSGIDGALFPNQTEADEEANEDEISDDEDSSSWRPGQTRGAPPPLRFNEQKFLQTMMDVLGIDPGELKNHAASQRSSEENGIFQNTTANDSRFAELPSDEEAESADDSDPESTSGPEDMEMDDYMRDMDRELSSTKMGGTFEKIAVQNTSGAADNFPEEPAPIDLDLNLVKNILESFSAQEGLPGPAGSILGSLGIRLPKQKKDGV